VLHEEINQVLLPWLMHDSQVTTIDDIQLGTKPSGALYYVPEGGIQLGGPCDGREERSEEWKVVSYAGRRYNAFAVASLSLRSSIRSSLRSSPILTSSNIKSGDMRGIL